MNIKISNKLNYIPAVINIIWSLILLFVFIVRVPEFQMQKPDGAGMLIIGVIIISITIFFILLVYTIVANLYAKSKIYLDLYFAFIPVIIILIAILLLRL